jgi:hypothetical protein
MVFGTFALGVTMLLLSVLTVQAMVEGHRNGDSVANSQRVGIAIVLVLGWLFVLRLGRVSLLFDERGVRVRNFGRTHRLAWTEVRQVALFRSVSTSKYGAKVASAKVLIVADQPIVASAALVSYANRFVVLKPLIDVCNDRKVPVYDR